MKRSKKVKSVNLAMNCLDDDIGLLLWDVMRSSESMKRLNIENNLLSIGIK